MENFRFMPVNITISLLNEKHQPVQSWYVVNAIPKNGLFPVLMRRKIQL
jgi:hypothetical protein